MPIYEYQCEKCDLRFEVMQRITDDPLTECTEDHCKEEVPCKGKLKKLISQTSFSLKGTGWYKTDYKD